MVPAKLHFCPFLPQANNELPISALLPQLPVEEAVWSVLTLELGAVGGHKPSPGLCSYDQAWAWLGLAYGSLAVPTYPPVLHAHGQHDDVADVLLPHQPPEVIYCFLQGPLGGNELLLGCIALSKRQTGGVGSCQGR